MSCGRFRTALRDQRGFALGLALLVLTLLTSLTLAFLAMGASEPMIAMNHKRGEAALALAEAGIERAIWALWNPTVNTAGPNTNLNNLNAIPAAYSGQTLFTIGGDAYTIAITIPPACQPGPTCLRAEGYVIRNGVAVPAQPAQLAQADIAARRVVQLQVAAYGGPLGGDPINQNLPGALSVAGTIQTSGNTIVDGEKQAPGVPNNCPHKAGATIRDKTTLPDGTVVTNHINSGGSAQFRGTPGQQTFTGSQFDPSLLTQAQLNGLKALAQSQGTYIAPTSSAQFNLTLVNGLMFIDTVNGQNPGTPPDIAKLASVKITAANNSGWLIVMGSIRIDGNVTYNGLVYAYNDLSYKGTGTGGIYGAVVTANMVDAVATVVDTDLSGNTSIYYDCLKVANGGGTFNQTVLDTLNQRVTVTPGSWREVSN